MFYVQCRKCKSKDVHHYRYKEETNTLNQWCGSCKTNMTQLAAARARKTRSKRAKNAPRSTKSRKGVQIGVVLVIWAFLTVLSLPFLSWTVTYAADVNKVPQFVNKSVEDVNKLETKDEVRAYVLAEAKKARVHVEKIMYIVENESQFDPNAKGDLNILCNNPRSPFYKKPFYSRGIFQFSRCWYPHVTDEQAFDVKFSTKLALSIISQSKKDCITQFTTCRAWHKKMGTL